MSDPLYQDGAVPGDLDQLSAINPAGRPSADIRLAAMNLLARREHSRRELHDKLKRRFPDTELLQQELQRLAEEQLQSDARFAESFVRQRIGRGHGPSRLRQEARQRGLADADLSAALGEVEVDWYAQAEAVFLRKFGTGGAGDIKEMARRARFMQYRGFHSEHYQHLLDR